jgi:hypothetical protein
MWAGRRPVQEVTFMTKQAAAWMLAVMGLMIFAAGAVADEPEEDNSSTGSLWNAEQLMDQACEGIARRYDLTEEQKTYTRKLMAHYVKLFLDQHQDEVRGLVADAIRLAAPGGSRDPKDFQRWAERSEPLWNEVKQLILKGNERWRKCLDDRQREIHDRDLASMNGNFEAFDKKFARWRSGGYDPEIDRYIFRAEPAAPPVRGRNATVGEGAWSVTNESYWDLYVRNFIKKYQLDPAQTETTYSILKECKDRAMQYSEARRQEIKSAEDKLRELRQGGGSPGEIADTEAEYRRLTAPLDQLFNEMKDRLEKIPTTSQRETYEDQRKEQRERIRAAYEQRQKEARERRQQAESRPSQPTPATRPTTLPVQGED